jgi:hypothetical protein
MEKGQNNWHFHIFAVGNLLATRMLLVQKLGIGDYCQTTHQYFIITKAYM